MVVYGHHFKRISISIFHTNIPPMSHKIIAATELPERFGNQWERQKQQSNTYQEKK